jgi:hypothetical protein
MSGLVSSNQRRVCHAIEARRHSQAFLRVNQLLTKHWRMSPVACHIRAVRVPGWPMSVASFQSLVVLALGFAVAGLLAQIYQMVAKRPPSFSILGEGARPATLATIPLLVFAAPFIIICNVVRDEDGNRNFGFVTLATILAGFWSLMSGTVVVMALEAIGIIAA